MPHLTKENLFRKETLRFLAKEVVDNSKNFYCNKDGLLIQSVSSEGKVLNNKNILEDLGDYLPFFLYFGENNFCQNQVEQLKKNLNNGLLGTYQKKWNLSYITAFSHTDLILGLLDYYQSKREEEILVLGEKIIRQCVKKFKIDNSINSFYFPTLNLSLPIFDTIDGSFIELFVSLYELTKNDYYLNKARRLIEGLEKNIFFQKNSLIPERIFNSWSRFFSPLFKSKDRKVKVMKNDTNTLYGFLEYYKVTKDKEVKGLIERWFGSFSKHLISPPGGVLDWCEFSDGQRGKTGKISLITSSAVLDLFCDLYYFLENRIYLEEAKKIANFWLGKQSSLTNLFPLKEGQVNSDLDAETDMVIALIKISELTNNLIYRTAAKKAFEGIVRYHRKKRGYAFEVNIENGKVINDSYKVKFITLFLKDIILFLENKKIYQNKILFQLLKDR